MKLKANGVRPFDLVVYIIFLLLSISLTFPLIMNLDQAIPGDIPCDPPMFVWNAWNFSDSITVNPFNPFIAQKILYPFQPNCVLHTYTVFRSLCVTTASMIINPIAAFNIVTILMFCFSAVGAYELTKRFTTNRLASFISGIIFSFCSYKMARLSGHYNLVDTAFIPFYILFLYKSFETKKSLHAFLAGLFLALTGYCCYYYLVFLLIFTVLFFIFYFIPEFHPNAIKDLYIKKRNPSEKTLLLLKYGKLLIGIPSAFITFFIIFLGPISPPPFSARSATRSLLILLILFTSSLLLKNKFTFTKWKKNLGIRIRALYTDGSVRSVLIILSCFTVFFLPVIINLAKEFSEYPSEIATVTDYPRISDYFSFSGRGNATLNKYLTGSAANAIERRVYLGIIPLVLAYYGWKKFRKNKDVRFWMLSGLIFFVLSLGPSLKVHDRGLFWLPYNIIQAFPFLKGAREPSRYIIITMAAIGILSALSITEIIKIIRKKRAGMIYTSIFSIMLFSLITADYATIPNDMIDLSIPQIYTDIAKDNENYTILEIPFKIQGKGRELGGENYSYGLYQYYQTIHHKNLLSGYLAYVPYKIFDYYQRIDFIRNICILQNSAVSETEKTLASKNTDFSSFEKITDLFDIRYIIVHKKDVTGESLKLLRNYLRQTFQNSFGLYFKDKNLIVYKRLFIEKDSFLNRNLVDSGFNAYFLEGWSALQTTNNLQYRYLTNDKARLIFRTFNISDYTLEIVFQKAADINENVELDFSLNTDHLEKLTLDSQSGKKGSFSISLPLDKAKIRKGINYLTVKIDNDAKKSSVIVFTAIMIKPRT